MKIMKYRLINLENNREKQYQNLKEISKELDVPIYIIRSINHITEKRCGEKIRPHYNYKQLYNKIKIHNIVKNLDSISFPE